MDTGEAEPPISLGAGIFAAAFTAVLALLYALLFMDPTGASLSFLS